jgi:pSer/pThr/pTyr-binding forkhead associated (FHA) protein
MAELRAVADSRVCSLQPEHLIGRGPQCALRLGASYVSAQHALVRWRGHWEVIDRGSRNGTHLNGERLKPGQAYLLLEGAILSFGHPVESWRLSDGSPPPVMVVALDSGEIFENSSGIIGVPSSSDPELTLLLDLDGAWKLEAPDCDLTQLENGQVFASGGRSYRFCCPTQATSTAIAADEASAARLRFNVSRDQEFVELRLEHTRGYVDLGARAHNYLLLLLARSYQSDCALGLAHESAGWQDKEALATKLKITDQQVDGEVYRIRRHFAQFGLPQAASIIERRPRTRQLRIGIFEFEIKQL